MLCLCLLVVHFDSTFDQWNRFRFFPVDFSNFSIWPVWLRREGRVKKFGNKWVFSRLTFTGPVRDGRSIGATKAFEHENQNDKRVKNTRVFLLRRRMYDCVFPNDPFPPIFVRKMRARTSQRKIDRRSGGAPRARTLPPSVRSSTLVRWRPIDVFAKSACPSTVSYHEPAKKRTEYLRETTTPEGILRNFHCVTVQNIILVSPQEWIWMEFNIFL